jgi:hypothetical protein
MFYFLPAGIRFNWPEVGINKKVSAGETFSLGEEI